MAEFCLDCWNKTNGIQDNEREYIISEDLDLCEGCGEWKQVVVMERKEYYVYNFKCINSFLIDVKHVVYFIWRLLLFLFIFIKKEINNIIVKREKGRVKK